MTHYDAFFFSLLCDSPLKCSYFGILLISGFGPRPFITDLFVALIITTEVLGPVHTYPDLFELFLSGYENIRVHTLCDQSVFISNSPVHTYSYSLRIH